MIKIVKNIDLAEVESCVPVGCPISHFYLSLNGQMVYEVKKIKNKFFCSLTAAYTAALTVHSIDLYVLTNLSKGLNTLVSGSLVKN